MQDELMANLLNDLTNGSDDTEAAALVSSDGIMIASALPANFDEDRVGAMVAALLSLGARATEELSRGNLEQVMVKGDRGYTLIVPVNTETLLTVLAKPSAKLGLIFLDAKRTSENLCKIL